MLRTSKQVRGNHTHPISDHPQHDSPAPQPEDAEPEPEAHLEAIVESSIFATFRRSRRTLRIPNRTSVRRCSTNSSKPPTISSRRRWRVPLLTAMQSWI